MGKFSIKKVNQYLKVIKTLNTASKSDFYKFKINKDNIKKYILRGNLEMLPFTEKLDLRSNYPFGTLSINFQDVIETHMSSGTTGKPTLSFYSKKDIDLSNKALSKSWANFGITKKSRVQFMMSYGLFSGAPLNTTAIQHIGAFVLPSGIQPTLKQLQFIKDFKIDTVVATPSYYLHLIDQIKENNIDWNSFGVKTGIAAGEVYTLDIKKLISEKLNIKIFDHYGLCEVNTGIIYECHKCGNMAILDEHVKAEVIGTDSGKHVNSGELGELVLTSLEKKASPIVRYKTGDIVTYISEFSSCKACKGRTIISRIHKRIGGTIFYKGIKLEPTELRDEILKEFQGRLFNRMRIIIPENLFINKPVIKIAPNMVDINLKGEIEDYIQKTFKAKFQVDIVKYDYFTDFTNTKESIVEYVK